MMKKLWRGLAMGIACGLSACTTYQGLQVEPVVRTIEITDLVKPGVLYASPGEEIRWQNLRQNPVKVGFLTMTMLEQLGCEKGVSSSFGQVNDFVTIPPGKSISLCLVRPGDLQYNVWFDAENARGAISPTATVRVGKRG
jgi:hypothetical protein